MKANELMIGDWVKFDGRPFKVSDVTVINPITNPALVTRSYIRKDVESPAGCFDDALIIESALPLKDIYPIPLTADILNKNFPDVRYGVAWYLDDIKSTYNETWYEVRTLDIEGMELCVNIRYVHELQHVLRLCGIEKEIVL